MLAVLVCSLSGAVNRLICFIPPARWRQRWWTTATGPTVFHTHLTKRESTRCGCVWEPSTSRYVLKPGTLASSTSRKRSNCCPLVGNSPLTVHQVACSHFRLCSHPAGVSVCAERVQEVEAPQRNLPLLLLLLQRRLQTGSLRLPRNHARSGGGRSVLIRWEQTWAHVLCVCVSGGFRGCGHGHKGHPGRLHWSCCGSTLKNSECLPPSVLDGVSSRSHLRTVEL